jgi:hypothetical protein
MRFILFGLALDICVKDAFVSLLHFRCLGSLYTLGRIQTSGLLTDGLYFIFDPSSVRLCSNMVSLGLVFCCCTFVHVSVVFFI